MSAIVAIQTNTVTFAPGTVARQRELAVASMDNYIPVGTHLQAGYGTETQFAHKFRLTTPQLMQATVLNSLMIADNKVYIETDHGMEYLFTITGYNYDDDTIWSSTFIEGDYWLCCGGHAVWRINGTLRSVEDVTTKLPYTPTRVESSGLRLIIGTNDTVSWSSATDRLDFSSTGTGAGSQAINVLGAYGELQALGKSPDGFVIYTTRGILVAANTNDATIPFSFQTSILPGYVLTSPYGQCSSAGFEPLAIFKGRGLCKISIASQLTATAKVETINPFIGQAEEVRTKVKAYNFFGGYIAFETPTDIYFMETSSQMFGMMTKQKWIVLIPGTSIAIDAYGNQYRLSLETNLITSGNTAKITYPDNIMYCDVGNEEDCPVQQYDGWFSGQAPAGYSEGAMYDVDFETMNPDGEFDLDTVPTEPAWGDEYQKFWLEHSNYLPCKLDQHTEVPQDVGIDLMPAWDLYYDAINTWYDIIDVQDGWTVTYGSQASIVYEYLVPDVVFTGIRANENDANQKTRVTDLLVYEYAGSDDRDIFCNTEDGDYNCNSIPDEDWLQITAQPVTVKVDNVEFHYQKNNMFTGKVIGNNHEVRVRGATKLSELRATLLGGGTL